MKDDNTQVKKDNTQGHDGARHGALIGNACILLASIFWGMNVSFTKALIPEWMSANSIVAVRLIGGCALMWLASALIRPARNERIQHGDWLKLISGGAIGLFLFIYLFVTSLRYGNPIDISIIMTLPPVFVLLITAITGHQRPSWGEIAGIAVSMVGAAVVILAGGRGEGGSDRLLGDLLAVASTICYALYLVILEGPTRRYHPSTMLRWVFLFAAIPALALLPGIIEGGLGLFTPKAGVGPWLEISFILLCPTFLAYFLVGPAEKLIGSELVSLYQYLLPVFATLSAVVMGLDHLKWIQVAAMAIIIAGMVLTNRGKRKRTAANK